MTTQISQLPTPPARTSPTTFSERSDDFLGSLPGFVAEANALAVEVNALAAAAGYADANALKSAMTGFDFQLGKNLIINGACQVDQLNSGVEVNPILTAAYPIDNCRFTATTGDTLKTQQRSTTSSNLGSLGVSNLLRTTVTSSQTPAATDACYLSWRIEGLNMAHLRWGSAYAQPVSLQFKMVFNGQPQTTLSGAICNADFTKTYPFSFTVNPGDNLIKIENIPGPTTGIWAADNTLGAFVCFDLGTGDTYRGANGSWQSGKYGVTGADRLVNKSVGTYLDISDVQLEGGGLCTEFERKSYAQSLRECQRYYWQGQIIDSNAQRYSGAAGTGWAAGTQAFPCSMRALPTTGIITAPGYLACSDVAIIGSVDAIGITVTTASANVKYRAVSGVYYAYSRI